MTCTVSNAWCEAPQRLTSEVAGCVEALVRAMRETKAELGRVFSADGTGYMVQAEAAVVSDPVRSFGVALREALAQLDSFGEVVALRVPGVMSASWVEGAMAHAKELGAGAAEAVEEVGKG